jgi:hypothetical protein
MLIFSFRNTFLKPQQFIKESKSLHILFDTHGPNIGPIDPHHGVGYFSFSIPHEDDLRISTFEEELSV